MAQIYNSDLSKELRDGAKIQVTDLLPNQLAEKVVPVMEVNPKLLRFIDQMRDASGTATGAITIYTTPTNSDFYLTNATISFSKNVTCDIASGRIALSVVQEGVTKYIAQFAVSTLTAERDTMAISLAYPLRCDKNSAIQITGAFTAGALIRCGSIQGYLVFNNSA